MFLATGGLVIFLLVTAQRWRERLALFAAGSMVFLCAGACLLLSRSGSSVNIQETWYRNSPEFLLSNTYLGMTLLIRSSVAAIVVAFGGVMVWTAARDGRQLRLDARPRQIGMLLFVPLAVIVGGLAASLLVAPNYSFRNVAVSAPFVWIALALLIDLYLDRLPLLASRAFIVLVIGVIALKAFDPLRRLLPQREEYRAASEFVRTLGQCAGSPIPITVPSFFGNRNQRHNEAIPYMWGYYLRPDVPALPRIQYLADGSQDYDASLGPLFRARLSGADRCPVLALVVHSFTAPEAVARAISEYSGSPGEIGIKPFLSYGTFGDEAQANAWVLLAPARK